MDITGILDRYTGTDAEVAAAINADPQYWSPLTTKALKAWLAEKARGVRLRAFAATLDFDTDSSVVLVAATDDTDEVTLAEVKGSLAEMFDGGMNNTTISLDPTPGTSQRGLIDLVAGLGDQIGGDIGPASVAELLAAGRPAGWTDITEADVTAARVLNDRREVISTVSLAANAAAAAGIGEMTEENTASWTEVRAAMIAEFDARTPE